MEHIYKTKGTCSTIIKLNVEDGILKDVVFERGCNGNLKAISSLVKDMPVVEVIAKLEGIHCGERATSCSDQLCKALHEIGY